MSRSLLLLGLVVSSLTILGCQSQPMASSSKASVASNISAAEYNQWQWNNYEGNSLVQGQSTAVTSEVQMAYDKMLSDKLADGRYQLVKPVPTINEVTNSNPNSSPIVAPMPESQNMMNEHSMEAFPNDTNMLPQPMAMRPVKLTEMPPMPQ